MNKAGSPLLVLGILLTAPAGSSAANARFLLQAKLAGLNGGKAAGVVELEVPSATPDRVVGRGAAVYLEQSLDSASGSSCVAANGCGLHVHSGESCDTAPLQGGHFYDTETYSVDPWHNVGYLSTTYVDGWPLRASSAATTHHHARTRTTHAPPPPLSSPSPVGQSSEDGEAAFTFDVEIGQSAASNLVGKVLILHGNDGSRSACGLITTVFQCPASWFDVWNDPPIGAALLYALGVLWLFFGIAHVSEEYFGKLAAEPQFCGVYHKT
jgi:hypothetical protein